MELSNELKSGENPTLQFRAILWFIALSIAIGLPYFIFGVSHCGKSGPDPSLIPHPALLFLEMQPLTWVPGFVALLLTRFLLREDWRTTKINQVGLKTYYVWTWLLMPALQAIVLVISVISGAAQHDGQDREIRSASAR